MHTRKTSLVILGMMVMSLFVSLAPTASAQQNIVAALAVTPPTDSVKPLQGALNFQGTVTVTFDNTGQFNVVGIPVTYTVTNAPPWASVVISPATDVITAAPSPTSPQASTASKSFTVSVTATDQAPAFQPGTLEITVTATPAPPGKPGTAKATVPITASYFSIIDVQLAEAVKIERPQTAVIFPLKVSNFGNANTKVSFTLGDKTENLNVPAPIPIVLQSKQAGGNQISADVPLTVQTPYKNGYMNEVGVVNYKISSAYALDPKLRGDETQVAVVITTKGFYVPGFEMPLLVGILVLTAAVLRRRK